MKNNRISHLPMLKKYFDFRITVIVIIFLMISTWFVPDSSARSMTERAQLSSKSIDGKILFAPMDGGITYLINNTGTVIHTWSSSYLPGEAVVWLGDGTILRTIKIAGLPLGAGGGVQKIMSDGTLLWDFRYNTNEHLSHHDVKTLPNGNVLLIAWETKSQDEAIAAGRNPDTIQEWFLPDHIIEVQPTGPTSGDIVWEWHVWDHLIQDYDASKANYGVVQDHPELVDVNYPPGVSYDWLHTNSIDYNEAFDQILISACYYNEIWVIDHSTTTEEAAGHTGGNSGKGGDLLYRWGNPEAYRAGTIDDKKFFGQHDATWIKPGCPGQGHILVFNNGIYRPGIDYSTVDEIVPPVNESGVYYLEPGSAYGPQSQLWMYVANPPSSFYSGYLSGAQRLPYGNTLICDGNAGRFFEVTPDGTTVWEYTNSYPTPLTNNVFKIVYVPSGEEPGVPNLHCTGSLSWKRVKPGATINGSFLVQNIGENGSLLNWAINTSSITWGTWTYNPSSGVNLTPEDGTITVHVSVVAPAENNSVFEGYIRVENQNDPSDFDLIPVYLRTPVSAHPFQLMFHGFFMKLKNLHIFIDKLFDLFYYG
jgi:hypothetical protein